MIKDVLAISCFDVEVKRFFNLARDVIIYKKTFEFSNNRDRDDDQI